MIDLDNPPGWAELVAAGRVVPPSPEVVERSVAAVRQAIQAPTVTRRRFLHTVVGGTVAAGIAVGVTLVLPPDDTLGPSTAVAGATEKLAVVAAVTPADVVRPGQLRYTVEVGWQQMQREPGRTWREEVWTADDGSVWRRTTDDDGTIRREAFPAGGEPRFAQPDLRLLAALPREPRALLRYLSDKARGGTSTAEAVFIAIGDMLRSRLVEPELRATMIRTLALLPGLDVREPFTDARGRTGVALVWTTNERLFEFRRLLVIDPHSARLVEERTEVVRVPDVPHTQYSLGYRTTLVDATVVDAVPADLPGR